MNFEPRQYANLRNLLNVNTGVQWALGGIMLLFPQVLQRLVYVPEPRTFIRLIGCVAISMGFLSWLAVRESETLHRRRQFFIPVATLAVFNTSLAFFLGLSAHLHLVSWLGFAIHAPLAGLFIIAVVELAFET